MENRGKRQSSSIFGGMGFYIALLVCVLAAGVVGYFALSNSTSETTVDDTELQTVSRSAGEDEDALSVDAAEDEPARPVIAESPAVVSALPGEELRSEEPAQSAPTPEDGEDAHIVFSPVDTVPETAAETAAEEPLAVVVPLEGETVAAFSAWELTYDVTLGDWRTHNGVDILADAGTSVVSAAAGTVLSVEDDSRLGATVTVDHGNGYVTTYASLQNDPLVMAGDEVAAGAVIGTVGNSSLTESALGAHLHFAVSKDGEPVDPACFLPE